MTSAAAPVVRRERTNLLEAAKRWGPTEIQLQLARKDLSRFVGQSWGLVDSAPLIWSWAMEAICEHLAWLSLGDIRFLMINIPPRQSKSTLCSVIWPAWEWIDRPDLQYLTGSYSLQLARRDSMKSRRLIESPWYRASFGSSFSMTIDENLKSQYSNNKGGRRVTTSTDATVTGEGGNRIILDDPHNALEVESDTQRKSVHDFWDNAISSRMNQANIDSWMLIGQRTHEDDLFGHVIGTHDMSEIVHLVLPNEFDEKRRCVTRNLKTGKVFADPRTKNGELLNKERLDEKAVARLRKTMEQSKYALQYQQDPKAGGGQILRREMWQRWDGDPPEVDYIFSVWDTALQDGQQNDYSARTDWGIFKHKPTLTNQNGERFVSEEQQCAILIGAWRDKVPFYKLRRVAKQAYYDIKPDWTLIEKKVSGISLIQEFRRAGIRITPVSLDHGSRTKIDIVARAQLAAPMLEQGLVYYMPRNWAEDVIDECARVPGGVNDDYASTVCMALLWLRRRHELNVWEDEKPDGEVRLFKRRRPVYG